MKGLLEVSSALRFPPSLPGYNGGCREYKVLRHCLGCSCCATEHGPVLHWITAAATGQPQRATGGAPWFDALLPVAMASIRTGELSIP